MHILATFSDMERLGAVVDLESGSLRVIPVRPEFIHARTVRPACRPFGITWSSTELFISNHRQLLAYDHSFNYLRTLPSQLQINVHQLAFHDGRVWAVSPWTNSLIGVSLAAQLNDLEFDLTSATMRPYIERALPSADKWHFNSLLWTDNNLYVAAHAFGEGSFISRYSAETFELLSIYRDVGHSIHGLAADREGLCWISTATMDIRSSNGRCLPLTLPGYARGFAVTAQYFIVGISEFLVRGERSAGDSWVQVIDREDGSVIQQFHLRDTGSINDLRLLDGYDFAHCVPPLLTEKFFECG